MRYTPRRVLASFVVIVAGLNAACDDPAKRVDDGTSAPRTRQTIVHKIVATSIIDDGRLLKMNVRTRLADTYTSAEYCEVNKSLVVPLDAVDSVEAIEDELFVKLARISESGPYRTAFRIVDAECIDADDGSAVKSHAIAAGIAVTQLKSQPEDE